MKWHFNTTSEAAVRESEHDVRLKIQPISESTNRVTGEKSELQTWETQLGATKLLFDTLKKHIFSQVFLHRCELSYCVFEELHGNNLSIHPCVIKTKRDVDRCKISTTFLSFFSLTSRESRYGSRHMWSWSFKSDEADGLVSFGLREF